MWRAALVGLLLLGACTDSVPADLTIAHDSEPESLDPARISGVGAGRIAGALFEGLTRLDTRTLEPRPGVAKSWSVSGDGLCWTFHLRANARWSNGRPVTAADFRYSWLRLLDPDTAAAYPNLLFPVTGAKARERGEGSREDVGIHAPDAHTLVVRLDHPVPWLPALTAFFSLYPVPRETVEANGDRWTREENFVGNGPFVLERHRFYREILLARSPTWWNRSSVALERIRILPVPDANTQLNLYETGAVDLTFSVPSTVVGALRGRPDYVSGPRLATAFLRVNVTRPALADPRVRRAIGRAIDREAIVKRITRGGELPARSFVPPVLPDYRPATGPGYDPAGARRELEEAGHPGGRGIPTLTLLLSHNPDYAALATVLKADLERELGIRVRLDVREWKVYLSEMKGLDYDLAFSQWIGDYPDPTTFLDCFRAASGNNRTGWADPAYDALLDRAAAPRPGETPEAWAARRAQDLARAEARLLEAAPLIPLYHPTVRSLVSPRIRGFEPNVLGLTPFQELATAK